MNRRGFLGALAGALGATAAGLMFWHREAEVEIPVEIHRAYGAALIEEGGYEARTTWEPVPLSRRQPPHMAYCRGVTES